MQPAAPASAPDLGPTLGQSVASGAQMREAAALNDGNPFELAGLDLRTERWLKTAPGLVDRLLHGILWPITYLAILALIVVFVAPWLMARWRIIESKAEAEVVFDKKRAELKAEAEAADKNLDNLEKRFNVVSLGFREVVKKIAPSVVTVSALREPRPDDPRPLGRVLPVLIDQANQATYVQLNSCAGVIVKPGFILTNYQAIHGAERLHLTFASGAVLTCDWPRHVKVDALTDLALIHLPDDLPAGLKNEAAQVIPFANPAKDLEMGDMVLGLDSPLGFKNTLTHGIVGGKGRILDKVSHAMLVQVDAPTPAGGRGGPLFDLQGQLVGLFVDVPSDQAPAGLRFALPANEAKKIVDQLADRGEVVRGWIGITMGDLSLKQAETLKIDRTSGVEVSKLARNQPAAKAGLQPGDIIVRYNNQPIAGPNPVTQLRQQILDTQLDAEVPMDVLRGKQRITVLVRVGKRPADAR